MPKTKPEPKIHPLIILILGIIVLYIIWEYLTVILLTGSILFIIGLVILIVGAYYILPALGITGIATLLGLLGLGRK